MHEPRAAGIVVSYLQRFDLMLEAECRRLRSQRQCIGKLPADW
jgi:hypothetical protein